MNCPHCHAAIQLAADVPAEEPTSPYRIEAPRLADVDVRRKSDVPWVLISVAVALAVFGILIALTGGIQRISFEGVIFILIAAQIFLFLIAAQILLIRIGRALWRSISAHSTRTGWNIVRAVVIGGIGLVLATLALVTFLFAVCIAGSV